MIIRGDKNEDKITRQQTSIGYTVKLSLPYLAAKVLASKQLCDEEIKKNCVSFSDLGLSLSSEGDSRSSSGSDISLSSKRERCLFVEIMMPMEFVPQQSW